MTRLSDYKRRINRQFRINDIRERVFQDNVIRPFLQKILKKLDIEPVDIKIQSPEHDYLQYCGEFIKKGKRVFGTPDLCISKNWNWYNKNNKIDYRCVVEIKSPALDTITGFEPEKYSCLDEVKHHLNAKTNKKVILTDCITWVFYENEGGKITRSNPICLGEIKYKYRNATRGKRMVPVRNSSNIPIVEGIKWNCKEEEFMDLIEKIKNFVEK